MNDFEEIIQLAEDIRTSEEPNSITASMVGTEFLRLAEYARYILDRLHAKTDKLTNEEIDSWNALAAKVDAIIKSDPSSPLAIEIATRNKAGIVKIGKGLEVLADGTINVTSADVDVATTDKAGIVKIGDGLDVANDGTISLYKAPSIDSFSISPSLKEVGEVVTSVTPTFSFNKVMKNVKINNAAATSGTAISGSWTESTDFTLTATDGKNSVEQAKRLVFGKKVYIGSNVNELTATVNNITGLSNNAVKTGKSYGNFTTSSRGFVYYAFPDSWGVPSYASGGFTYSFVKVGTVKITAHGDTADYALYRSGSIIPSSTLINIS